MPKGIKGFQKGHKIWLGKKHTSDWKRKMQLLRLTKHLGGNKKGVVIPTEQRIRMNTNSTRFKGKKHTLKSRMKTRLALLGKKNHQWRGGLTKKQFTIRRSLRYRHWKERIFERDDFTCKICKKHGGDLEADHIKPFSKYPNLRFSIINGRTLCISCHRATDTYGFHPSLKTSTK